MRTERIDTSLARLRRLIKRTAGSFALVRVVADDAARGDVLSALQGLREEGQALRWRSEKALAPSAQRLHSPYDTDARYGSKLTTTWLGY